MGTKRQDTFKLIASIGVCLAAGAAGSVFTIPSISSWYVTLSKPEFTPPNWVFGPVWTLLYILMGIALYLVWNSDAKSKESKGRKRNALVFFAVQLILNVLWSAVFFGVKSPSGGLVVIVLLWAAIAASIVLFWRISKRAGGLLLPYLAWTSFALFLNYFVWVLNP